MLMNFDNGVLLVVSKTGFAWSLLFLFIVWGYVSFYPDKNTLREFVSATILFWPVFTVLASLSVGFFLNLYTKKTVITLLKLLSSIILTSGFVIVVWILNPWLGALIILIFLATPLVIRYFSA
ncbi:hypothetical protein [Thermococcus sp.]